MADQSKQASDQKTAEQKAADTAKATEDKGQTPSSRAAGAESDDLRNDSNNSLAPTDDPYVGTSPEYQNYASEADKPMLAPEDSDEGKVERNAIQALEDLQAQSENITRMGYTSSDPLARFEKKDEEK